MRILHYVHNYGGFSGATNQAINLSKELSDLNCTSQFVSEKNSKNTNDYELECKFLTSGIFGLLQFLRLLLSFKPDIVHFHGASFKYLIVSSLFSKVYWKTTLYGNDDFKTLTYGNGLKGWIKKKMIPLIDKNNSLTAQNKDVNRVFLDEGKIVTIPNGVYFDDSLVCEKEKIVLIIAAVIPRKRVLESILFFKNNFEENGYTLFIIGPFGDANLHGADLSYSQVCRRYASERIVFTGMIKPDDVKAFLTKSMYLILFSVSEGLPNVVLEALSHGVFPILTSIGGVSAEVITEDDFGIIIGEADIQQVLEIPPHTGRTFEACREIAKSRYSMDIIAKDTYDIYKAMQ